MSCFPHRHLRKRTTVLTTVAIVIPLVFQLLRQGWIVSTQQQTQQQQLQQLHSFSSSYDYDRFVRSVLAPHNEVVNGVSNASIQQAVAASHTHNLSTITATTTTTTTTTTTASSAPPAPPLAACLLFKDDNELFQEWLAYHYTLFSLRYLIVGEDYYNSHNPQTVLQHYNNSDLQYWIWPPDHFTSLKHTVSGGNVTKFQAHRALVVRQKHFVTQCLKFVQTQLPHVTWTALIDPDEYLVVRSFKDDNENHNQQSQQPQQSTSPTSAGAPPIPFHFASDGGNGPSCFTLPRLLIGPLENRSCVPGSRLSTLRFVQHAPPHDFAYAGFAKAVVDVSRLSLPSSGIKNIHRPVPACPYAGLTLHQHVQQQQTQANQSSWVYYLHHYHGSWEQYAARGDARRDASEWQRRQHVNDGIVNCVALQRWVSAFVQTGPPAAVQALREMAGTNLPFLDGGGV